MSRALAAAAVAFSLHLLSGPVAAQSWSGGGGNANWSNNANWSGGAPGNGIGGLAAFSLSGSPLASTVDVPWTLTTMQIYNFNWAIGGTTLTLAGNGTVFQSGGTPTISAPVVISNNRTFDIATSLALGSVTGTGTLTKTSNGTLTIGGLESSGNVTVSAGTLAASPTNGPDVTVNGTLSTDSGSWGALSGSGNVSIAGATFFNQAIDTTFSGSIGGTGEFNKVGPGRLTLSGSNTWSGNTVVAHGGGTLEIAGPAALPSAGSVLNHGRLEVNSAGTVSVGAMFGAGSLQVTAGTVNALGPWSHSGDTTVAGGSLVTTNLNTPGAMTVTFPGTWTTGNATIGRLSGDSTTILKGNLVLGTDNQDSTYTGFMQQGPAVSSLKKVGSGTFSVTQQLNIPGSPVTVEAGTLRLQGGAVNSGVLVKGGAKVTGQGTANTIQLEAGGTVEPSFLAANTVGGGAGTVKININGTGLASQYGQVNAVFFDATGMTLELAGSYVPVVGNSFTIVDASNLTGTFDGLPAGAVIPSFNGVPLRISYTGGDGNDIVLSVATQQVTHGTAGNGTGSISPASPHAVVYNQPAVFTMAPAAHSNLAGVAGSCGGSLVGNTYTTAAVTADCTVIATFTLDNWLVTPVIAAHGTIDPTAPKTVAHGSTTSFTITPEAGYTRAMGGTCPVGTFAGDIYTTGPIVADCTVAPTFTLKQLVVTPSAGTGGTISPATGIVAGYGTRPIFTVTPDTGHTASVGGTCGGSLAGTTYTTDAITADCTVVATFTLMTYTVTPSAGAGGSIAPDTPQTVNHGATTSFTVTPNAGFAIASVTGCGGSLAGSTFTTGPVTANCTVTASFTNTNPPRLGNISTRMQVLTGNDVMIGGFVIGGSANKTVAIVATGPSLAQFGITNALANPKLTLVRSSDQATIGSNDDWQAGCPAGMACASSAQLTAAGFAPTDPLEAAIMTSLPPGAYTAIVEGVGGGTGVAVVGVYEVDGPTIPLANISTRGRVLTGNDVMIGGFVVQGSGSQTVAIVATGPSLAPFGIANPLANPKITLVRSSDQAVIDSNDDWQSHANSAQLQAAGFAPTDALESGIHTTLPPGAYTVIVEGIGGGTGVAVVGVYKAN